MRDFLLSRWRGQAPLARVFWGDMLAVGTVLNLAATAAALALAADGLPIAVAAVVYLAPVPWNVFLFAAVWRSAGQASETVALAARLAAFAWVILAVLL